MCALEGQEDRSSIRQAPEGPLWSGGSILWVASFRLKLAHI